MLTSSCPEADSSCSRPTTSGPSSNQLIPNASTPSSRRTNDLPGLVHLELI